MNYLELSQRLVQETGLALSGPAAVTSQTGMNKKVVDWVSRAWLEIQNEHDWDFLWQTTSFTTTVGKTVYDPVDDLSLSPVLGKYIADSFRIYTTSSGIADQGRLEYIPWDDWSGGDQGIGSVSSGKPSQVTIRPDNSFVFDASPDVSYTITFDYYRQPVTLSANTDTPAMPSHFHDLIVYKALLYYAAHEEAPEIYQDAVANYSRWMAELMGGSQLPQIDVAASPLG